MTNTDERTRFVEYDGPEAVRLADIVGVLVDLEFARAATQALLERWPDDGEPPEQVLAQAYWNSALVSYARCFGSGVRGGRAIFDIAFGDGPPEAIGAHEYYRTLRDKHIAHSVNPLEQVAVIVGLDGETEGQPRVVAQGHMVMVRVLETRETTHNFLLLLNHVESRLRGALEVEEGRVLASAQAAPIESLTSRETARITAPSPEQFARGRRAKEHQREPGSLPPDP